MTRQVRKSLPAMPSDDKISTSLQAMLDMLENVDRHGFRPPSAWARAACLLILNLRPHIKTFQLLESLPIKADLTRNGQEASFDQIDFLNCLAHIGYCPHRISEQAAKIDTRLLPCLCHVPEANGKSKIYVLLRDASGEMLCYDANKNSFTDFMPLSQKNTMCWVFRAEEAAKNPLALFTRNSHGQSWFRALLGRFSPAFGQILLSGLFINIIALATPIYTMTVYDRIIGAGVKDALPMLTVGISLALGIEWVLRQVRSTGLSWIATRMDNLVGNAIFQQLVGLPALLIERASVAAQIARLKTFEAIRDFFCSSVFMSLLDMPFVIIAAVVIYVLAGPLVFVPLVGVALYGVLFFMMHQRIKVAIRLSAKAASARQQFTIDTFEKVRAIRVCGLSMQWQRTYRDLSGRDMMAQFQLNWLGYIAETIANSLTTLSAVACLAFGVEMIWTGQLTTGALVATMMLVWRVLTPFYSLCTMLPRLEQLTQSIVQVNNLMDIAGENEEQKAVAALATLQGQLRLSHVSYSYGANSDTIFTDLTCTLRAGEFTVVTGDNGSGKTTLMKMLKGLYRPEEGTILLDGFDMRQLDPIELRRQIAYVPQHTDIFTGTLLENLRLCNPLATREDVNQALDLADALEAVNALPQGLDTQISRYGDEVLVQNSLLLSKIALARAYLQPAALMILDELPNTVLFGNSGKKLKDYIARNKAKRSIIMVTYREDFIALADQLITLRRGETPVLAASTPLTETGSFKKAEVA